MSRGKLIRWTGLAGVVSGVLVVVTDAAFSAVFGDQPTSVAGASSTWLVFLILSLVAIYLALLALVGLYARQTNESGGLGLTSFIVASIGTSLNFGFLWAGAFVVPPLAESAPEFLDLADASPPATFAAGFMSAVILFALGWALLGIASLRAKVLPSLPTWLLIVGSVLALVAGIAEIPFGALVFGVALAWLGWWLWSEKQPSAV